MKPTYEDIVKYHSQKTLLLVNIECYALPLAIRIIDVIEDGAIFKFAQNESWMMGGQWVKTEQVEVLYIFPSAQLLERMRELEKPVLTLKDVAQTLAKAEVTNKSVGKCLDIIFDSWATLDKGTKLPKTIEKKPKKCKRKKNCPTDSTK